MKSGRLEAFSDGVIAILITIMVLEFKTPATGDVVEIVRLWPEFISYALSFIYVGIYWNNHHHLLQAVENVNGVSLWANLHLLFWLSLVPFGNKWMASSHFAPIPVLLYGVILFMCAISYMMLLKCLIRANGPESAVAKAVGSKKKEKISLSLYLLGVLLARWYPHVSSVIYIIVALIWFIPDSRIERQLQQQD